MDKLQASPWWALDIFPWRALNAGVDSDPYAAWAPSYPPHAHNALMHLEETAVTGLLPDVSGCTVLDAGSGSGRYMRLLKERGAGRVVGVDSSMAMLRRADPSAWRIRADFRALPVASDSCDVVVSGLAVVDVPDLKPVISEWSRVLRPKGVAVCSTLHPRGAALKWTRTFDTPRGPGRLPAFWHSLDDFIAACDGSRLTIDALVEPCFTVGDAADPGAASDAPVALVVRAHCW